MFDQLKIAIVLNTAWNIYNFRMGVLKAIAGEGAQIVVIAPEDEYVAKIQAALDCQFIPLRQLDRCSTSIWRDLALWRELHRIYKKEQIDVALHYTIKPNIYGSLAGKWSGTKTISTVTGLGISFLKKDWVNFVVRRLYKLAFWASDRVAFQNNADRYFFLGADLVKKQKAFLI
ncbi:MAG: glycosyltransferase, partial [Bacteroidota bacterium]